VERRVTRWQPHIDLARLLGALDQELLATPLGEVRMAFDDGPAMRAAASEVRQLIADLVDVPDGNSDTEAGLPPVERGREHRVRQH
jgi:hypothetical protein